MDDLFAREQKTLDRAQDALQAAQAEGFCSIADFARLVDEYRRLLRQLRRVTRLSDRTAVDLNASMLNLRDKVCVDEMTGIYNRRFLDETLPGVMKRLAVTGGSLSVLMLDVDFFKRYNDTYGHSAGDRCLRLIAQCLKNNLPCPEGFVARYGGEEFVAVLPGMDMHAAQGAARFLLDSVRACRIPHDKNDAAPVVTVSIGIAAGRMTASYTPESFLNAADKALYAAKRGGRNQAALGMLEGEHAK